MRCAGSSSHRTCIECTTRSLSRETNSNFGFNLPWWDRLFGTYRAQPAAGHDAMTIGIEQFRDPRELGLDRMLLQPFRGDDWPLSAGSAGRRTMSMRRFVPRLALALLLVAGAACGRRSPRSDQSDDTRCVARLVRPMGADWLYGPLCVATVAVCSRRDLLLAGGALFGPIWGSLWNLLGATLGATLAFLVARYIVGRLGRTQSRRTPQAAHRRRRRGGLAFRRLRAAGTAFPLQSARTMCWGSRAFRFTITSSQLSSAWRLAQSPTPGSDMLDAGR